MPAAHVKERLPRHDLSSHYDRLPDVDHAYATLLTRPSYLQGVQVLARSLRLVGASHPLIVLHTKDSLPPSALTTLRCEGCYLHGVDPYALSLKRCKGLYALDHYADCWNKMHLWRLERYQRLVYLDADMLLLQNPDSLFLNDPPAGTAPLAGCKGSSERSRDAAAMAILHAASGAPSKTRRGSGLGSSIGCNAACRSGICSSGAGNGDLWSVCDCYHARGDAAERARCPFSSPHQQQHATSCIACCKDDRAAAAKLGCDTYFNAGLLVLTPSLADLEAMEAALATPEGAASIGRFAEQDFLNWFWQREGRWRRLSWHFNAQWHSIGPHQDMWQSTAADITVVHFNDKKKPWSKPAHERCAHPLEARWSHVLEHVPPCHAAEDSEMMTYADEAAQGPSSRETWPQEGTPMDDVSVPSSVRGAGAVCGGSFRVGEMGRAGNIAALVE